MIKFKNNFGFTIVELLIATTVLTVVLSGASFVVVQVGRLYFKGIIQTRTQDAARNVIDQIARPIQLENASPTIQSSPIIVAGDIPRQLEVLCIGNVRYQFVKKMQVAKDDIKSDDNKVKRALWQDTNPDPNRCEPRDPNDGTGLGGTNGSGGNSLLPEGMSINELKVEQVSSDTLRWRVIVDITYGDKDLQESDGRCKSAVAGGQFCAQARFETVVVKRVRSN